MTEPKEFDIAALRQFQEAMAQRGITSVERREAMLVTTVGELAATVRQLRDREKLLPAAVVAVHGDRTTIHSTDGALVVRSASFLSPAPVAGDCVRVTEEGQILLLETDPPRKGPVYRVTRVRAPGSLDVSDGFGDLGRVVLDKTARIAVGHHVLLDPTLSVVTHDLGMPETETELAFTEETGVTWDDVAGLEQVKADLREVIEGPVLHAALYREFGKRPCKGILLAGPPGLGKTLLAKAMATAIATMTGAKGRTGFIYVKGPEVLNAYVGASEGAVRKIFAAARTHKARTGTPAIVCIDEGDAILGRRSDSTISMEKTIVPQFLAEMDGLEDSAALVVVLTNRPDTLDPAVTRDGRIDLKFVLPRPTRDEAAKILAHHLGSRLLAPGADREALAAEAAAEIFSPKHVLFMVRVHRGMDRRVGLADFVSGAMCAGVVDKATSQAIRRFRDGDAAKGITGADLFGAVKETSVQLRGTNHDAELAGVIDECGGRENVKKVDPA